MCLASSSPSLDPMTRREGGKGGRGEGGKGEGGKGEGGKGEVSHHPVAIAAR